MTPSGGFTGNVTLTAAVTSSPTGASGLTHCSFGSTGTVDITSGTAGTATLTISSIGATSSQLEPPVKPRTHWFNAAGANLACLLLFGMPVRRRGRRAMLGLFALSRGSCGEYRRVQRQQRQDGQSWHDSGQLHHNGDRRGGSDDRDRHSFTNRFSSRALGALLPSHETIYSVRSD